MERSNVKDIYKWDTKCLFTSEDEWEKLFKETEKKINFEKYKNKLGNINMLLECLKEQESISKNIELLYLYAHMRLDEDTRISKYNTLYSKAGNIYVKFSSESSFIVPELTELDEKILLEFSKSEILKDYDYMLREIIKNKKHILPKNEENLLAMGGEVFSSFHDIFSMIDNADLPLPEIDDGKGGKIKLTHGMYGVLLHGTDRKLRERAFKEYYKAYIGLINTISANYFGNVKKDVYLSKVRKYKSCLEKALSNEDVEIQVYENLLKSVDAALPIMHKYIAERKKVLKLDTMNMYDIYAPIAEGVEIKLTYEKAYELVIEGLKPLGDDYIELLKKGYLEGWIDVEETEGKRSGAYSTGIYGYHPFVLLNYQQTTHDVFTIAHEMGHAIHSYHSNKNQPYSKADYRIFVAEVASTVNEVLLLKHILKTAKDKNLKKYLLSYYIDMIRTTLFRQTMFAEFEYIVHNMVENGQPLNKDNMNEIYLNLNKKYYGNSIVSNEEIAYEWARIPHFYTSFYVYKYATGIISAISIAEKILKEGESAVSDYKRFLSSGGSDSPVELLKLAGIDLTTKQPFERAMQVFSETLEEFSFL
jgi:oligoendopeptidase F